MSHGGTATKDDLNVWTFPNKTLEIAVEILADHDYEFTVTYSSPPTGPKAATESAAYLRLMGEERVDDLLPGPQLIYANDGQLLGNQDLIGLIAPFVRDVGWTTSTREGFWTLSHAASLPEPIKVRTLFNKWPRTGGKWVLSHDGREFFTSRNTLAIATCGVAWATDYQYRDRRYARPPLLTWNGEVINALVSHDVQFSGSPVYYLKEPI